MDEERPFRKRESFIIRLWQRETSPGVWLGEVQHVGSGQTAVVRTLDELTAVVKELIATSATSPESITKTRRTK